MRVTENFDINPQKSVEEHSLLGLSLTHDPSTLGEYNLFFCFAVHLFCFCSRPPMIVLNIIDLVSARHQGEEPLPFPFHSFPIILPFCFVPSISPVSVFECTPVR